MPAIAGNVGSWSRYPRGWDSDKSHVSFLNHFVGKVLPDVIVLGSFPTPDDLVAPLMHMELSSYTPACRGRSLLGEAHAIKTVATVQDFSTSR
jgi:hypothetical protein